MINAIKRILLNLPSLVNNNQVYIRTNDFTTRISFVYANFHYLFYKEGSTINISIAKDTEFVDTDLSIKIPKEQIEEFESLISNLEKACIQHMETKLISLSYRI